MSFPSFDTKKSFFEVQQEMLEFWKSEKIFEESIEIRKNNPAYRFYDGPPFVTGTPHYGHILGGTIKDVVPRYRTMKGKKVERVRGRDCHGIPIEQKVQTKLGLKTSTDVLKAGIQTFIEECYVYTRTTSAERNRYVDHTGRRVDMENAYRTMDPNYMESVMRVFKQLYEKGHIYKGKRVSLYSTALNTPISNFEVAMDNSYGEANDPAVTIKFKLSQENIPKNAPTLSKALQGLGDQVYCLAWTTTPWSLVANMALAVNTAFNYVLVRASTSRHEGAVADVEYYIVAQARAEQVFKDRPYEILETFPGEELIGRMYQPLFPFYTGEDNPHNFKIYNAEFISEEDGTGIGHEAPEFGEVDFQLGKNEKLTISEAMDAEGKYTAQITDYEGVFYRDANPLIMDALAERNLLFKKESITHRVAFCPRSNTPLVYKAQDSRFINIQNIKDKLLENNEDIYRFPHHLKHGRFANTVQTAPDRCISRTRFWGTPMPVYLPVESEEQGAPLVIGSREELFQYQAEKTLTKIILVRHGRTDYNDKHRADHEDKARLTTLGKNQAQDLISQLKDCKPDVIYSSPFTRCLDTISPFADANKLKVNTHSGLVEFNVGEYQDKEFKCDELLTRSAEKVGGGESTQDVYERARMTLDEIVKAHPGQTIVICSHQNVIELLRKVMYEYDYDAVKSKHKISNKTAEEYKPFVDYIFTDSLKVLDLHLPYIDKIQLIHPENGKLLKRIPEVLDCWLESASMPYAQVHFPFENEKEFKESFPADFVVEYMGQVRAWFYVMHVISTLLYDKPAFTHVVTTGTLKGTDGRKMSKSYGNFPDPRATIEKYGADALRVFLLQTPLPAGNDANFSEDGLQESIKSILLPLWNATSFFITYANIDQRTPKSDAKPSDQQLDQRIMAELQHLLARVEDGLQSYDLQSAAREFAPFFDSLTNRYIRRSRRRFRKSQHDTDKNQAYQTLYTVLTTLCQILAPFAPFSTEYVYKLLTGERSVHLTDFPLVQKKLINESLVQKMTQLKEIVSLGLARRSRRSIRVRQPLASLTISMSLDEEVVEMLQEELNVKKIIVDTSLAEKVQMICKPNAKLLGPKYGKQVQDLIQKGKAGTFSQLKNGKVQIDDIILEPEEYEIDYLKSDPTLDVEISQGVVIAFDAQLTPELIKEGYVRDLVRQIQEARKEAGYDIADRIQIAFAKDPLDLLTGYTDYIQDETLSTIVESLEQYDIEQSLELGDAKYAFVMKR